MGIISCKNQKTDYQSIENGVIVKTDSLLTRVLVYSPDIIRVTRTGDSTFPDIQSLMVIKQPENNVRFSVKRNKGSLLLSTDKLNVFIDNKGNVQYYKNNDEKLLAERRFFLHNDTDTFGNQCLNMQVEYVLNDEEGLYGLGQHQTDYMNYRGKKVDLVQLNTAAVVPFLLSTNSYGLLWDNYSHNIVNNEDDRGILKWHAEDGDALDYYFIAGENPDQVIAGYRHLTGDAPLYGKWAYGYWQSKERYVNREDILSTALQFREYKFPIDNIVQDWRYWGDYGWSALLFDEKIFPNPGEMIDILHQNNFHLMISVWSVFGNKSPVYKEMEENDLLFNTQHWSDSRFYDPFSPQGRQIYWKHLKNGLFDYGIDAWWMDGTEPEFKPVHTAGEMRDAIVSAGNTALGPWTKYLNAYSLMTVKAAYEGQRNVTDDKRVFILTRSAYAGQQRYAGAAWSGDISASFKTLKTQISAGINYCMSGLPYWTHDIGAFHVNSLYPEGCNDDAYKELYVRWFQYGAFCPLFRSHGTQTPREPWNFGEPGSWAYDALLTFTNLRYRLMPYIYSLAWKVTNEQYTIMRGLPMAFPNDKNVYETGHAYMFGNEFLVAPVTENFYYTSKVQGTIIPSENFFTEEGEQGGLTATYYDDVNFTKAVNETRDKQIDFSWAGAPPVGCRANLFSVRWVGEISSDESGDHKFIVSYRKGVKIWIGDKLVIDQWKPPYQNPVAASVHLDANKRYPIKIEYFEEQSWPGISLSWEKPSDRLKAESQLNREKEINVYLPANEEWFDFWTGHRLKGGQTIKANAPIDIMPLYVKAGSIVPFGPYVQYANEKNDAPLEIRIYPGKDAEFVLYEDENDNYNYEQGKYSLIKFTWDNDGKKLIIGGREGDFPGIIKDRIFNIVLVSEGKGTGVEPSKAYESIVEYSGEEVSVSF